MASTHEMSVIHTSLPKGRDTQKRLQTLQNDPQFRNTELVYNEVAEVRGGEKRRSPVGENCKDHAGAFQELKELRWEQSLQGWQRAGTATIKSEADVGDDNN